MLWILTSPRVSDMSCSIAHIVLLTVWEIPFLIVGIGVILAN
jgi:hypothetical protein